MHTDTFTDRYAQLQIQIRHTERSRAGKIKTKISEKY